MFRKTRTRLMGGLLFLCLAASGCANRACNPPPPELASINIIDRNGLSEVVNSPDRLKNIRKRRFSPIPALSKSRQGIWARPARQYPFVHHKLPSQRTAEAISGSAQQPRLRNLSGMVRGWNPQPSEPQSSAEWPI